MALPAQSDSSMPDPAVVAGRLRKIIGAPPALAVVLGSGFDSVRDVLKIRAEAPYSSIPGFAPAGVAGHAGRLLLGEVEKVPVAVLCGRAHYYEGWPMGVVTFPIRVLAALGIKQLLLTNAAGAINRAWKPGEFMCLTDHINFQPENPLRGVAFSGHTRFVDLSEVYSARMNRCLSAAARKAGVRLRSGVYLAVSGPSYETPAEIRAFARLGADAVGMSTVAEAIVGRQCGMEVAGLSCLTNMAAGRSEQRLSHEDVLAAGRRAGAAAAALLHQFVLGQSRREPIT